MKEQKEIRLLLSCAVFAGLVNVILIWMCGIGAVAWAGFNGFHDISMEYTKKGDFIVSLLLEMPVLFLGILFLIWIVRSIQWREKVSHYVKALLFLLAAIGMAVQLYYCLPGANPNRLSPPGVIGNGLMYCIRQTDWMEYPAP